MKLFQLIQGLEAMGFGTDREVNGAEVVDHINACWEGIPSEIQMLFEMREFLESIHTEEGIDRHGLCDLGDLLKEIESKGFLGARKKVLNKTALMKIAKECFSEIILSAKDGDDQSGGVIWDKVEQKVAAAGGSYEQVGEVAACFEEIMRKIEREDD